MIKAFGLIRPYYRSHRYRISLGLFSLILVDFFQLLIPRAIKGVIDALTFYKAGMGALVYYASMIASLAIMIGLFRYIWRRCLLGMARRVEEGLRNRLVHHIQTLSASYFDKTKTGDLMAHATNDITQVRMAAGMGLVAFNDAVVLGLSAIGFMLYIHVELTLYVLIPMPLIVLGTRLLGKRMFQRYQSVQEAFSELTETVRERFGAIRLTKAHAGEKNSESAVRGASQIYVSENIKLVTVTAAFFPFMLLMTNISVALVLLLGGKRAILNEITPGDFVAFIGYLNLLTWPMMAMGWVANLIQRGGASLHRLKVILEKQSDIRQQPNAVPLSRVKGRIVYKDVCFSYEGSKQRKVLDKISLEVSPGAITGIVGPPGSGKSTILSLVPRLYDVSQGRISLDGKDIRDYSLSDLRRHIAYVPQEPFLFAGTVRDNIAFGCPGCTEQKLSKVIKDTGLAETIDVFPSGLDTLAGEKGVLLSGGQKQRIALARALLTDRPIFLLDDPISQVDARTGRHIIETLERLSRQKTVLIVSHRLSAIHKASVIVSLDQGRIVEHGTHQQLVTAKGYYARVHALQELENAI
ncbi:MAG: ABC transporter ATP-binding protein [Desulfobacteraceae bacterium]|nr:ABC transporter ATP-binding protein [Desulfobacteraceae bacterium]